MKMGLLWYDAGSKSLAEKVTEAAERYQERVGEAANVCYVHPDLLPEGTQQVAGLRVHPSAQILRHHYWVGREAADAA
jgi:hypothetical protein